MRRRVITKDREQNGEFNQSIGQLVTCDRNTSSPPPPAASTSVTVHQKAHQSTHSMNLADDYAPGKVGRQEGKELSGCSTQLGYAPEKHCVILSTIARCVSTIAYHNTQVAWYTT